MYVCMYKYMYVCMYYKIIKFIIKHFTYIICLYIFKY